MLKKSLKKGKIDELLLQSSVENLLMAVFLSISVKV